MNSFYGDLDLGHRAEELILGILRSEFPTLKRVQGYSLHCDLKDDDGYTFEVKLDIKSKDTGNVCIEYKHRDKPSAISVSKAMEWVVVYYLNGSWVYSRMKTSNLKAFIKRNWKYLRKYEGKGDKSSIILVSGDFFSQNFPARKLL